ncbi:uncharacterized protein DFL_000523 [Arthrobotrys flagrans]|uniref:Nephrocystin 3-like N-terminal domain-containing protein n=1 Tax=Arthrobotrys flagrans TaxID=97331 RepID=A0A437AE10_ARTFL|nr:hypothetical protein DFL_000523 [Arthrobotrys flagrans]
MNQTGSFETGFNSGIQLVSNSGNIQQVHGTGYIQNIDVHYNICHQNCDHNAQGIDYKDANFHRHMELWKARIHQTDASKDEESLSHRPGPCDWILERECYKKWSTDEAKTSVLWIQGRVGCGKSTILSRIVDELNVRSTQGEIHLLYFYISATDEKLRGGGALIRSFMRQIMKCGPTANKFPGSPLDRNDIEQKEDHDLRPYLFNYLRNKTALPVFIIVDALDEVGNGDRNLLLKMIIEEHESTDLTEQDRSTPTKEHESNLRKPCFKILLSSRDDVGVETIRTLPSTKDRRTKLDIFEIQPKDIADDIQSFIQRELVPICFGKSGYDLNSDWQIKIVNTLTERANGTFLWVHYQVMIICNMPWSSIGRHVETLATPGGGSVDGINSFYKQIIEKLTSGVMISQLQRETARKVFTLLVHASGPIPVDTLLDALFPDTKGFDPKDIVSFCKYLVDIDESQRVFRWTHYSVYQYFTNKIKDGQSTTRPHKLIALEGTSDRALIAEICLSYLCRPTFARAEQIDSARYGNNSFKKYLSENKFLEFACTKWAHYSRPRLAHGQVKKSILELCKNYSNMQLAFHIFLHIASRNAYIVDGVCPTHIISYFHLSEFFKELDRRKLLETHAQAGNGFTAVHWAIDSYNNPADINISEEDSDTATDFRAHEEDVLSTVKKLVEYNANINIQDNKGCTPLYHAARQGYLNVVRELLQTKEIMVDLHGEKSGTPLIVASYKGHAAIVEKLIEKKADATISSEFGTALHAAASQGSTKCVSIILEDRKARLLDIAVPKIGTPLHEAAYYGQPEIVGMLLKKGFGVDSKSESYGTPLQAAAGGCYKGNDRANVEFKKIFKMLLESGADVNAQGGLFQTALHAVVHNGHCELADMLLQKGARVNIKGVNGTALQIAQQEGYTEIVKLLKQRKSRWFWSIFEISSGSGNSRAPKEVSTQGGFVKHITAVPLWMFMTALKADDEKRMEMFFTAYQKIIEQNINANQMGSLEVLALIGEQVFQEIISFTVLRHNSRAGKPTPAAQILDTKTQTKTPRSLAETIVNFLFRIFNKWSHPPKAEQDFPADASIETPADDGSTTKDFPFYSEDPAFRTLDRLTNIAVAILGNSIDRNNWDAVNLLSTVWTRALFEVQRQEKIGDEMLRDLINARAEELMLLLKKGELEGGKRIAKVAVQLLATAIGHIGGDEKYKHLVCSLARIWALAMGNIHELGEEKKQDYLTPLLETVIEAIKTALKNKDGKRIEQLAEVILAVFIHVITELSLDSLFDKVAGICLKVWDTITVSDYPQGELARQALKGKATKFIDFLRSVVDNNRKDIFEFAKERGDGLPEDLNALLSTYKAIPVRPQVQESKPSDGTNCNNIIQP